MYDIYNNMAITIDWLEFTYNVDVSLNKAVKLCGILESDIEYLDRGALGYRRMCRHSREDITFFYEGNENMGVHLRVKGSAIHSFFKTFIDSCYVECPFGKVLDIDFDYSVDNVGAYLFKCFSACGHFTRVDIAIDNTENVFFNVSDLKSFNDSGQIVSKMRNYAYTISGEICGEKTGETIYFGSRQSDVMLRVYDKGLQKKTEYRWVRWEFECKGDKLREIVKVLANREPLGKIAFGLLTSYFRIILLDDSNKTRCSILPLWLDFTLACKPLKLTITPPVRTIDDKLEWLDRQVMPTIAGLVKYFDGDMSFVYSNLNEHYNRLRLKDRALYESNT